MNLARCSAAATAGLLSALLARFLYAMHDALVKPMPGNLMTPSLAESWTVSADQRAYDFKLREGLTFHNDDPFTAEDVKFSFQRAKGARILKEKVREIVVVEAFYGTLTTGAGWIVPKKHIEKVGDEPSRSTRSGSGPVCPQLRLHLAQRDRDAGGGARAAADQSVPVVGAPGRGAAEAEVMGLTKEGGAPTPR